MCRVCAQCVCRVCSGCVECVHSGCAQWVCSVCSGCVSRDVFPQTFNYIIIATRATVCCNDHYLFIYAVRQVCRVGV